MSRKKEREILLKILFERDLNPDSNAIEAYMVFPYIKDVFEKIRLHGDSIDSVIIAHLKDWSLERLPAIDRSILRISVAEILYREDIPLSVSINEAVELAKKYSDDKSAKFINGLLGNLEDENR